MQKALALFRLVVIEPRENLMKVPPFLKGVTKFRV